MVKREDALSNVGSWIEPLDGALGPNTDLWIKVIAGLMIATVLAIWWFMGWRERMREERNRKAETSIPDAIKPQVKRNVGLFIKGGLFKGNRTAIRINGDGPGIEAEDLTFIDNEVAIETSRKDGEEKDKN
jgi:hypothetical protein